MLTFSFENFEEVKRSFDPKVLQKALNTTITRTATRAQTEVSRAIREVYNVKASTIAEVVTRNVRRTSESTVAVLQYRGGALPVDRFASSVRTIRTPRGKRVAVSARVRKDRGRQVVRGAFPLRGREGPTMERTGDDRLPIERVFRLSVPQMLNEQAGIVPRVQDFIERTANIELNRNLRFFEARAR